jgi:hypothetical protein
MANLSPIAQLGLLAPPLARASVAARVRALPVAALEGAARQHDLARFEDALRGLRRGLEALRTHADVANRAGRTVSAREAGPARAVSTSTLELEPVATFTTLASTEEVNAVPTSFTPFGPSVSGTSTTEPTLGGVYSGAEGDDVLTFLFRDSAVVGTHDRLRVRVLDGDGHRIDRLNFRDVPAGTPLTLSNGLTLALGPGVADRHDSFEVQVSASVGSRVDPTKPFDGVRNESPNFESGLAVTAGSFEVNGVRIDVAADDTLAAVVARISASEAGVDAAFDASAETVVLTQRTAGSAARVLLSNDSSGFLAATKLAGASEVLGQDGADPVHEPIASVPALAGVADGFFTVNGVVIAVDTATDSLGDVLDRINASVAGVTAILDPATRRVEIAAQDGAASLALEDGTSGFLSAVRILEGTYMPVEAREAKADGGPGFRRPELVRDDFRAVRRGLDAVLGDSFVGIPSGEFASLRSRLTDAVGGVYASFFEGAEGTRLRSGYGIDFDLRPDARSAFQFDADRLDRAVARGFEDVQAFLFAEDPDGAQGLIPVLIDRVETLQELVGARLGRTSSGRLLDLRA